MNNNIKNSGQSGEDDLDKMAPTLAGIKKGMAEGQSGNPFATPDGYFESLNSDVMKKIESLPDFETTSSENPFKVPAGYFDSLPTIVQQRIIDLNAKGFTVTGWISGILSRPAPKYALAFASVVLVVVFSTLYFTRTVSVEYATQQAPESEQLDAAYLQQLDESDLADLYAQQTSVVTESQDDGMENYLLDNDIDMNSITDQL
ncbi:MAG: hypothetical protein NTV09_05250 [Bacteroidetes bacterium]|nr:hypothetical protein [Bacteroidota bacterium]